MKRLNISIDGETAASILHVLSMYLYKEGPLPDALLDVVKACKSTFPDLAREFDFLPTGDADETPAPSCRCHGYN